jgi:hypothetical protein
MKNADLRAAAATRQSWLAFALGMVVAVAGTVISVVI